MGLESDRQGFHSKISTTSTADRNVTRKLPENGDKSGTSKGFESVPPDKDTASSSFTGAKKDLWRARGRGVSRQNSSGKSKRAGRKNWRKSAARITGKNC